MPRKPDGDKAMTGAERLRRFRERQRAKSAETETKRNAETETKRNADPLLATTQQELAKARAEIARLTAAPKAAPLADEERKKLEGELRTTRHELYWARDEIAKLKKKIVKPVKVPLDPESEAVRQIEALKKRNKKLDADATKWLMQLRTLVPSAVKAKVAKALTETTTSPANRLDALQAWNGLGLNNLGK